MSAAASPGLDREARFLLEACAVGPEGPRREALSALAAEGLDAERLLQSSLKNRVAPLVHDALAAAGVERADRPFRALARHARRARLENLVHLRETLALVELCAGAGIRAVPYKGAVLAASLYRDFGERQFYDLDLLVPRADVPRARELLLARGYVPAAPPRTPREARAERRRMELDCELHFRTPDGGILVELHWEALPHQHRFGFELRDFWDRLVPIELGGRTVEAFAPEDLLLVLSVHGGEKHRWNRLQMLADVARLLDRYGGSLDWDGLLARAGELRREGTVLLGVLLAWTLLGAPSPEAVVARAARRRFARARAAATLGRLFREDSGLASFGTWRAFARELDRRAAGRGVPLPRRGARMDVLGDVAGYAAVVLTPEWTDRQALPLPRPLAFLYWVYRPLRLLRRHGGSLARRV